MKIVHLKIGDKTYPMRKKAAKKLLDAGVLEKYEPQHYRPHIGHDFSMPELNTLVTGLLDAHSVAVYVG